MNSKAARTPEHDTAPSNITDHPYVSPSGQPWGKCAVADCGMAEAAHRDSSTPFKETATSYRCPDCVTKNIEVCEHPEFRDT